MHLHICGNEGVSEPHKYGSGKICDNHLGWSVPVPVSHNTPPKRKSVHTVTPFMQILLSPFHMNIFSNKIVKSDKMNAHIIR